MGLLKAHEIPARVQVIGFFLGALMLSLITLGVMQGQGRVLVSVTWDPTVLGYVLIYTLYMIPMVFLTILPATVLPPARIGVLLMSEVVVGAISAALLSGEMFGAREALGTLLIIAAALFEILGKKPKNATQF
jgi:drug/metabolite transporter (DMT)-like permease